MRICGVLVFIFGLFAATSGMAQTASPQLQGAIDAWLADDDAAALPAMSALAANGDDAAALLLGRIERMTPGGAE
ncbi:MAG: hypothetical protein AAFU55_15000, partial [Pseudomonadota bacterium]